MKKIISLFILITSLINCTAQTYPLNTFFEDVPDHSYMKDLDNHLSPYIGTYIGTYQGKEITLYITKEDYLLINTSGAKKYYQDVLHIKYIIKEIATGITLQDNINPVDPNRNEIISIGTNTLDNNSIALIYSGTNCGVGNGRIVLKMPTSNQISWSFYPNSTLLGPGECANLDKKVYLPVAKDLIFTKQ